MTTTTAVTDVVLRDGSTVSVRSAVEGDIPALLRFFLALTPQSLYYRFHGLPAPTEASLRELIGLSTSPAVTLVAESLDRIVAFASYHQDSNRPHRAEVAFAVADDAQGHGIGTRLLEQLANVARDAGVDTFEAHVLGNNRQMLEVFRNSGLTETMDVEHGICHVSLSLARTDRFVEQAAARSQAAAAASIRPFFEPRVVAVIGANRDRGKFGSEILHNLVAAGFTGTLVPIHPRAGEIAGLRAYPRITEVTTPVDLAMIVVPASEVAAAVDDCIAKHVPAICVISAGFGECDAAGRALEAKLLDKVRRAGIRLIGPNCMGLLNTDPVVRLNATFSPVYPPRGHVAMSTQSGALGLAILDYAKQLDIGISSFVSIGNKIDVSGNDLIQYWAQDSGTSVILLYVESFGNPKKFGEIARRVGRTKPIVVVKAGRSAAGARAASSHTGALASNDVVVDALFRQAGVIRTERLEEMFDVAALLSHQPLPRGARVAILTNAGGPGILAADACEANGLTLPALSEETRAALRTFLPAAASINNPVDMLASAPADHYRRALLAILRDDSIDSVITIFIPPLVTQSDAVAQAVSAVAVGSGDKPVLGVFMRSAGAPSALSPIPCYAFPESAALALSRVTAYAQWRTRPIVPAPILERFDSDRIRQVVETVLKRGGGWVLPDEAQSLLRAAGIAAATSWVVNSPEEALASASDIGFPVALKALGPSLLHKTERGAVSLNIGDESHLRSVYADFVARFGAEMTSLLVQEMVPKGVEMIVGAFQDPIFGPLVVCGTGGVLVDLLADTAFRLHPLNGSDAAEMIDELRGARLLRGYRGSPTADEAALRDVLMRVSALVQVAPEIQELDLNPVIALTSGARVADVRCRVEMTPSHRPGRRVAY